MTTINPAPAEKPFTISPSERVSALFTSAEHLSDIIDQLTQAGFSDDHVEVFMGPEGTEIVNPNAQRHSGVVRFLKNLELLLSDETVIHKKTAEVLRNGGMLIQVNTEGNEQKKQHVARVVRQYNPVDAQYWGRLSIEKLA